MLKVMTIVGTRPEIIRLSRTISKLDEFCEHILVHTGQNYDYELNEVFFSDLGIRKPDIFLEAAGKNAAETIGQLLLLLTRQWKISSLMLYCYLAILTVVYLLFLLNVEKFPYFIWKPVIVALISVCQRKSTVESLITPLTLI